MSDYERVARVIRYLEEHQVAQPELDELASEVGLSPSHFHRLFSRWAGVTPKEFLQCLTLAHAKEALREGESVLDAALESGLSGPGRLHDLCVTLEAASPGEVKDGGAGWTIRAAFAETPFGICLVGESPRGICHLSFVESCDRKEAEALMGRDWPGALVEWDAKVAEEVAGVFQEPVEAAPLRAVVRGTAFQVRVWKALLSIPPGRVTTYGRIAELLGDRGAARAVGSAVGANRLAYLIPCHRVIRETGVIGDYRWGKTRKKAVLAWEGLREPCH